MSKSKKDFELINIEKHIQKDYKVNFFNSKTIIIGLSGIVFAIILAITIILLIVFFVN